MLKIIEADEKYLDQYKEAYEESLRQIKLGNMKQHNLMFMNSEEENIIQKMMDNRDASKLPPEYVPSYDYFAVDGEKLIGVIHIRVRLTVKLLQYGGHIGYGINPKYWRMGYGTELLKLAIEQYSDLIENKSILVTCDDDNVGSYKIIEANGGVLENKVKNEDHGETFITRRYWIEKRDSSGNQTKNN